ncbi:hypothetical protein TNCT_272171 [Trichonephila clavata]|uniref:Uncharacterized protein n=1 Tax=Trichonephila clavata TaxID=2740835 RepID=A0A8X6J6Y9_TRICU|nr:hypothetical protein TNCT_272171 [Trichonephila clavata]
MTTSKKLACFFLCVFVLPVLLCAGGHSMMGGMLGGGGKHGNNNQGLEALLAAGILAKMMTREHGRCGHHHHG